jgi:hypothetical protein
LGSERRVHHHRVHGLVQLVDRRVAPVAADPEALGVLSGTTKGIRIRFHPENAGRSQQGGSHREPARSAPQVGDYAMPNVTATERRPQEFGGERRRRLDLLLTGIRATERDPRREDPGQLALATRYRSQSSFAPLAALSRDAGSRI